jgi:hypothetical protein
MIRRVRSGRVKRAPVEGMVPARGGANGSRGGIQTPARVFGYLRHRLRLSFRHISVETPMCCILFRNGGLKVGSEAGAEPNSATFVSSGRSPVFSGVEPLATRRFT